MHVSVLRVICEGAYKPGYQGEEIRLDCLIDSINTGVIVECQYRPSNPERAVHGGWIAHFPESPYLEPIEEPKNLDYEWFSCSGIPIEADDDSIYECWATYAMDAGRKHLEKILGAKEAEVGADRFAELAQAWIKSHGMELYSEIPDVIPESIGVSQYTLQAKLFWVRATDLIESQRPKELNLGVYEATSPKHAITRAMSDNPRNRCWLRNWKAIEVAINDTSLVLYKNLVGQNVLKNY